MTSNLVAIDSPWWKANDIAPSSSPPNHQESETVLVCSNLEQTQNQTPQQQPRELMSITKIPLATGIINSGKSINNQSPGKPLLSKQEPEKQQEFLVNKPPPNTPKSRSPFRKFRLRPSIKCIGTETATTGGDSGTLLPESPTESTWEGLCYAEEEPIPQQEQATSPPLELFREKMDIVAYQEWPLVRKQRHKYCNQQQLQRSPSSVCGFSVETIATQLGRSPVVVSFDNNEANDGDKEQQQQQQQQQQQNSGTDGERAGEWLEAPVSIKGRIQTGRFRSSVPESKSGDCNCDEQKAVIPPNVTAAEADPCQWRRTGVFLEAIESALSRMMCID